MSDALTAREIEVARLAADGLSNYQISAKLFLSVRTVEGHLFKACKKMGVNSRHDIALLECS